MKKQLYTQYTLLPLKSNKAPNIKTWGNLSPSEKCDWNLIEKSEFIGFVCGFGGVEVIDIDNHFDDADLLFEHIANNYDLTDFPIVKTQGGGYHIYFRTDVKYEDIAGNLKFARRINAKGRPETLVESRGKGGYVVCPPSPGYTLLQGDLLQIPILSDTERVGLINTAISLDEIKEEKTKSAGKIDLDERPGDAYNQVGTNVEATKTILSNAGWTSANGKHWCRPDKSVKDGISATFGKVGDNKFYVFSSNASPFEAGESYSMFAVKALLEFNGDYKACAISVAPDKPKQSAKSKKRVVTDSYNDDEAPNTSYVRIGEKYYKKITTYDKRGKEVNKLVKWGRQTLVDDYGKHILETVPKYDDYVNVPSHVNYKKIIGKCYNTYEKATGIVGPEGEFPTIVKFMNHIFGEQIEMGYDYIRILWSYPMQILPVLCLVSKENETGKTTFGNFLGLIFGNNYAPIGTSELETEFNGSYATKLLAMCDETWISYKVIDKLKNLATAEQIQLRKMHSDHSTIGFFCKWILCSNRTKEFIKANEEDERYWVRKLTKFEGFDPNFLEKLKAEVPAFLHFLTEREIVSPNVSRMWFSAASIRTEAFEDVIRSSKDVATKDFVEVILEAMESQSALTMEATIGDLKNSYFVSRNDITVTKIKEILGEQLFLEHSGNVKRYTSFITGASKTGRFYTIEVDVLREFINEKYEISDSSPSGEIVPTEKI